MIIDKGKFLLVSSTKAGRNHLWKVTRSEYWDISHDHHIQRKPSNNDKKRWILAQLCNLSVMNGIVSPFILL